MNKRLAALTADGNRGFTLLEVIVAMTILGLGFSALFAGMSQSSRNIRKLESVQRREMFTRNLLAEIDLVEQLKPGDTSRGTFDDGTRWHMEIQPFILPTPQNPNGIVRVEVGLEWDGSGGLQTRKIETYRLVKTTAQITPSLEDQLRAIQ